MTDGEKKADDSIEAVAKDIAAIPAEILDIGSGKPSDIRSLTVIGAIIAGIAYFATRKKAVQPIVPSMQQPVEEPPRITGYW